MAAWLRRYLGFEVIVVIEFNISSSPRSLTLYNLGLISKDVTS